MFLRAKLHLLCAAALAFASLSAPAVATAEDDVQLPKNLSQEYLLDKYATPDSSFAYLNHTMVHYRDEGQGPAVLLIHGSVQDLYDWDDWVPELTKHYRVVRLDLPAAGLTGRVGTGDYSMDNTMRTVDMLMDRLGIERFSVVGTSLGGIVAFRYASTRPERVATLILMNSAGVVPGNERIIPPQPRRYDESLSDTLSRGQIRTILRAVYIDPEKVTDARVERTFDYQRRLGRDEEATALVSAYDQGQPELVLGRITAPVLVLWGAANRALDPTVADEFAAMLTQSSVVEKTLVPGGGHWMHIEAPARTVLVAKDFLQRRF